MSEEMNLPPEALEDPDLAEAIKVSLQEAERQKVTTQTHQKEEVISSLFCLAVIEFHTVLIIFNSCVLHGLIFFVILFLKENGNGT
jgi:hypothetical protein